MAIAIGLLKMLLELQQTRKNGALDAIGPGARVRLFVEEGKVVFADEGTVGETLGRILVREQVLDSGQYAAALEWMTDLRAAGKKTKLGEVFVDLGLLTSGQVHAALAAQVQEKVMRALGWTNAGFTFFECHGPLELADRFETAVEPLLVAALRLADRERVDELLAQARDRFAALRADHVLGGGSTRLATMARLSAFRLAAAEDAFVQRLDGSQTVGELLSEASEVGVDRGVILAALLLMDALDLHAGASPSRRSGVPRPAPKLAPSSGRMPASLPPSTPRMPSGEPMAPLLAERAYQAGKRLARAHRLDEAVVELRRAAAQYPAAEYDLWAAWAEARSDPRGEDAHVDALRAAAELAIEQDTERGFASFVLGHLARRAGDDKRADELLARARAIDPEVGEVDAWSVRLQLEPESTQAGTRGDVRALAPLMTTPAPMAVVEEADAGAEAEAGAEREPDELAEAEAVPQAVAAARVVAAANADSVGAGLPERRSSRGLIILALVFGAVGATVLALRASEPAAEPSRAAASVASGATAASSVAEPMATTSAPVITLAVASASAGPSVVAPSAPPLAPAASYAVRDAGLPNVEATKGVLGTPPTADGHRIYVDGHLAGVAPPLIVVACGRHVVKIGSQGRDQPVFVPCGGMIPIAYP